MTDPGASATSQAAALAVAAAALVLRSLVIAGEAGLSAIGTERAQELSRQSRVGRALARLKSDAEATAATIRVAHALTVSVAFVSLIYLAAARGLVAGTAPKLALTAIGGAFFWAVIIAGEVVPRSLAAGHPEAWALRTAPLLLGLRALLAPVARAVRLAVEATVLPFGAHARFGLPPPPLDEIERMLTHSRDVKAPEPALVRSLFEFGELTAKDTMVPRTDVVAIPIDANPRDVIELLLEEGHTRIPVYRGTLDKIVGLIHVKDLLPLLANPELIILEDLLRPATVVPWNRSIAKLMRELQRKRQHLAVVVDEYGGVAGIVTLADIVARIVGDIPDEFDTEAADVVPATDGAAMVQGDMRVSQFNDAFGTQIAEDSGYETIGGFVSFLAGALPAEGDRFFHGGLELQVARRDPKRVLELRVTRLRGPAESRAPTPVA